MNKQEHWFSLIRTCEESTISQKQFCRENNLSISTFGYWRRKYIKSLIPEDADPSEGTFIPLKDSAHSLLEIIYPNGVRIQVPEGTHPNQLSTLIGLY